MNSHHRRCSLRRRNQFFHPTLALLSAYLFLLRRQVIVKEEVATRHVKDVGKDVLSPELTRGGNGFWNHRAAHKEMHNIVSWLVSFFCPAIDQPISTLEDLVSQIVLGSFLQ